MMKDGVLNIDKPAGWTSHDVVAKLRGVLRIKKVGHAGTLDPDATGVLLVCFGKGTKVVPFLMEGEKEYEAVLRLGEETDTEDATGTVLRRCEVSAEVLGQVRETLESFVGTYEQIPPMYSAIKVKGVPLYRSARAGKSVERTARPVTIREIRFQKSEGRDISFSVVCSKGTYIRTLCVDIGAKLGVGGHLLRLRRTRSGSFRIGEAVELNRFAALYAEGTWAKSAYTLNDVLAAFPAISVREHYREKILHGAACGAEGILKFDSFQKGESLRLLDPSGTLLAIGRAVASSEEVSGKERLFKIETVLSELSEESAALPALSRPAGGAAKESIESPLY
ncbi:MAG: tRNA pseudouridine(55) synthase TruB [Nitrospirae bacterium]|nr:tRNA pseudouridine(55) synthase TruB [Candidatus Manganitrophaceae bacterium]